MLYYGVTDSPGLAALETEDLSQLVPQPPTVQAGPDQTVAFPGPASLSGAVLDETYDPGAFTPHWTTVTGPGAAVFASEQSLATTAVFPQARTYRLRISAAAPARAPAHADTTVVVTPTAAGDGVR